MLTDSYNFWYTYTGRNLQQDNIYVYILHFFFSFFSLTFSLVSAFSLFSCRPLSFFYFGHVKKYIQYNTI